MENKRLIINIESTHSSVIRCHHLDWFEIGIWCDDDCCEFLISEIKKNLFFDLKPGYGAQHYYSSLFADEYGFKLFFDVRTGLKNCPLLVRCSGSFFRHSFSYSFCDGLLKLLHGLDIRFNCVRFDSAIDFISMSPDIYIPIPAVLPVSGSYKKDLKWGYINDSILDDIKTYPYSGDALLRVYNKLTDRKDADFLDRHPEYSGCFAVWRLEFQFRGDTCRAVAVNSPDSFRSYNDLFRLIMGQCMRRYAFSGFAYDRSDVSSYIKPDKSELRSFNYAHNQMLRWFHKRNSLEKRVYPNGFVPDFVSESVIDLMSASEALE